MAAELLRMAYKPAPFQFTSLGVPAAIQEALKQVLVESDFQGRNDCFSPLVHQCFGAWSLHFRLAASGAFWAWYPPECSKQSCALKRVTYVCGTAIVWHPAGYNSLHASAVHPP